MNPSLIAKQKITLARLTRFKRSLDSRMGYLVNRCDLVLTADTLEIYAPDHIIFWQLLNRAEGIGTIVGKTLDVDRFTVSALGMRPYSSRW